MLGIGLLMIMNAKGISNSWGIRSCEECSTRLNMFRKKKICHFCKNSFCQVCTTRIEENKFCCRKCQILTARPLDRNKLLNLRSRDLINYLESRQIPTNGCVEKEDLVNLLIRVVNNSCFHPSSTTFLDSSTGTNSYSDRNNSDSTAQLPHANSVYNDGIRITGHNSADSEISAQCNTIETIEPLNQSSNTSEQISSFSGMQSSRHVVANQENISVASNTASNFNFDEKVGASDNEGLSVNKPLMLSDIKNKSDLEALSIKQLKDLLIRNRTDFKGCVERDELIQKANRLWSDYIISRKDMENLSLEELCKICMDAPIECVLLECGHMATCTSCGKQLCECPICRQFVVRCVRTFKA